VIHRATIERTADYKYRHTCGAHTTVHDTDGDGRLCRLLVAAGLSGAMEVRDVGGALRYTIPSIEKRALRRLRENDRGMAYEKFRAFDPKVFA